MRHMKRRREELGVAQASNLAPVKPVRSARQAFVGSAGNEPKVLTVLGAAHCFNLLRPKFTFE